MTWLKSIYNRYPVLTIGIGFLLFWTITIIIMRMKNRKDEIARLNATSPNAMALSYLNQSNLPRGIRNNNPGNLRKTSIDWLGKLKPGNDSSFEQFQTFVYGLRAQIRDIKGDIQKKGQNTLTKLITAYAPEFENNTNSYIQNVANRANIGPDQQLTGTKEELRAITKAMAISENGNPQTHIGRNQWFDDETFNAAWDLSLT